jgi:1-acyl-sn-glycerol-3-phosphate acyltransferase
LIRLLTPTIRLTIEGLEHVPAKGPVIVVCNHVHNADPALVSIAFPRPLHFMAKKEAFAVPLLPRLMRLVGAFPVDRGKADRWAIRRAEATLAQGIAVGMFPEGTRSVVQSLQPAHPGAAMIALRTGAPVQPAAITGSERLPGNGSKSRPKHVRAPEPDHAGVRVRFGPLFILPREIDGRKLTSRQATDLMMAEIARLLPPDYRGVYAGPGTECGGPRAEGRGPV